MFILPLLAATTLFTPVNFDGKKIGCRHYKPFETKVKINVDIPDIRYNLKTSRRDLTNFRKGDLEQWKKDNDDHVWASKHLSVEGLAVGAMGINTRAQFIGKPYDRYGQYYCPFIKAIEVNVHYNTQIFIASDIPRKSCEFKVTHDHELEHHEINVSTVNEITEKLKQDMPEIIAYMERRYIPRSAVKNNFKKQQQSISDALKIYSEEMYNRMSVRNDKIDSPEEYQRLSKICD